MIAKNIKGKSFGGCVKYIMNSTSELLEAEGVLADRAQSIIRSFFMQRSGRSEIKQPVGHIPIAFSPEDSHRLTNDFMNKLAKEYMQEMGIANTQYIIVRHNNTAHDHIHVVYNRIDNDLKLISVNNDFKRNIATCKKLKDKYELTYGKDKTKVNREKLRGTEKTKHEIYDTMRDVLPKSHNIPELAENLKQHGINLSLKYCRGTEIVEGVSFEKDGHKFKGSQIDRQFSYKGLQQLFKALAYLEEKQKEKTKNDTPTIMGVKLSAEQWSRLKKGDSVWVDNMLSKTGKLFSAYTTLSEDKTKYTFSYTRPDREENSISPQQDIQKQDVSQEPNTATSTTSDIVSAVGGLLDFIPSPSQGEDTDEARFRHQIQRKKKKRDRRM